MVNQQIEKLLIIQDRDQVQRRLADQLISIPREINARESEIEAERNALRESKAKLQGLEVKRNDLDTQVGSAEERVGKYKTQQLQVKKNEEYQALIHEIETLEKQISELEEEEISLMLDIDYEAKEFSRRESAFDTSVKIIQAIIEQLKSKEIEVQNRLVEAKDNFEEAKVEVEPYFFTAYDRLASRIKMPIVVPLEQQKCSGCHLRVSNDTDEQARKAEELTTCDNCGRIVFIAS